MVDRPGLSNYAEGSKSSQESTDSDNSPLKSIDKNSFGQEAPGFESSSSDGNKSGSDSSPDSARKTLRAISNAKKLKVEDLRHESDKREDKVLDSTSQAKTDSDLESESYSSPTP